MSDTFTSERPPHCLARMNEYVALAGTDTNVQIMMSNGAADCIIFVCHHPGRRRALLCHVDRNTVIDKLMEYTEQFVTGPDGFSGCNIYLISGLFCSKNYERHGIYQGLKHEIGTFPVEIIAATAYSLNIANGRMRAGAEVSAMCSQIFPNAATSGGGMLAMLPTPAFPSCVYKTKDMHPLTGGRPRASSGGSGLNKPKSKWED